MTDQPSLDDWLKKQDLDLLQEILDHGGMVVTDCVCEEPGCEKFRLNHPILMVTCTQILMNAEDLRVHPIVTGGCNHHAPSPTIDQP